MTRPFAPSRPRTTVERLRDWRPADTPAAWILATGLTLLAFAIRVAGLAHPNALMFDETYYAKDAWSLLHLGYEATWSSGANEQLVRGDTSGLGTEAAFIVHPPVGKWLIALGEAAFGMTSFGWRISAAVAGSLLVGVTMLLARRLSRSTLVGVTAGLLLTLDGLAFTMSRIALLDIFQALFLVAAVLATVVDRDWFRGRLADHLERAGLATLGGGPGPWVWWRPWRWVAGLLFGLAIGTKWNSLYVLAVFGVVSVLWDVGARRLAGADFRAWLAVVRDGVPAFVAMVGTAFVTYVASWAGWLTTAGGWGRAWGADNPDHPWVGAFGEAFASLLHYHQEIYAFHTGTYINSQTHPYNAHPSTWLLMLRPTDFDYAGDIQPGTLGCPGPATCVSHLNGMGTPLLWWAGALALVVALVWWLGGRDWRFGVPLLALSATWLPWFAYTSRPVFFFYAITIIPFTCVALALCLGLLLGDADDPRRRTRAVLAGVVVALVAANFAWLYPVLTGEVIPYADWLRRMVLRSWI